MSVGTMSKPNKSAEHKVCCFCGSSEDNELELGKIYEQDGIVTHYYCLLLSSNMEQRGEDNQGILGFLVLDIHKEVRRGKRLTCSYCKKSGATLGCCNTKCKKMFHLPCGLRAGSLHQFFGEFRSYCKNHRPKQKIDKHVTEELEGSDEVLCYICYEDVSPYDFVSTLWAPCCKKNAWFHRKCVQQLAMSAGYFFKCPLCNNQNKFQRAMQDNGIFIPSQDASWELVPNAFQDLLFRHDQCDATICLCPKGRKHTSSNASKWELTLCRTCGSQGIHMACGQLRWANPVWECSECTSILLNSKSEIRMNTIASLTHNDSEDSDSDISVGKDSPIEFESAKPAPYPGPQSTSKLRPGPQSYKLRQQLVANRSLTNRHVEESDSSSDVTSLDEETEDTGSTTAASKSSYPSLLRGRVESRGARNRGTGIAESDKVLIMIDSDDDVIEIISHKSTENGNYSNRTIYNAYITPHTTKSNLNVDENSMENVIVDFSQTSHLKETVSNDLGLEQTEGLPKRESECADAGTIMNIKITNITSLSPELFAKANSRTDGAKGTALESNLDVVEILDTDDATYANQNSALTRKPENSKTPPRSVPAIATPDKCKKVRVEKSNRRTSIITITSQSNSSFPSVVSTFVNDTDPDASPTNSTTTLAHRKSKSNNDAGYLRRKSDSDCYGRNADTDGTRNDVEKSRIRRSDGVTHVAKKIPRITVFSNGSVEKEPLPAVQCSPSNDTSQSLRNNVNSNEIIILDGQENTYSCSNEEVDPLGSEPTTVHSAARDCGDAGTGPVDEREPERTVDDQCRKHASAEQPDCPSPAPTDPTDWPRGDSIPHVSSDHGTYGSVFSHVANNRDACDKPRLIPEYVRLQDLKFRVRDLNSLQMVLYDTFSVNVDVSTAVNERVNCDELKRQRTAETSFESESDARTAASCEDVLHDTENNNRVNGDLQSVSSIGSKDSYKFSALLNGNGTCNNDDAKENLDPGGTVCCRSIMDNSVAVGPLEKKMKTASESNCEEDSNHGLLITSAVVLGAYRSERRSQVLHEAKPSVSTSCQNKLETSPRYAYDAHKATEEWDGQEFCKQETAISNTAESDSNNLNEDTNTQSVLRDCKSNDTLAMTESLAPRLNLAYRAIGTKRQVRSNNLISNAQNLSSDCVSSSTLDIDNSETGAGGTRNYSVKRKSRREIANCFRVSINLSKIRGLIDGNPALFLKDREGSAKQSGRISLRNRQAAKSQNGRSRHQCYKISTLVDRVAQLANCANDSKEKFNDTIAAEKCNGEITGNDRDRRSTRNSKHVEKHCAVDR